MTISPHNKVNIIGLIISLALIMAGLASRAQSSNLLYIGQGLGINGSTLYNTSTDSVKQLYALVASAVSLANQAGTTATNALNTANGAVTTNVTQGQQITAVQGQTAQNQADIAIANGKLDSLIANVSSGNVPRIPNTQTTDYTAKQSDHGGCIVMTTKSTAVTLPALIPGTTFTVRNSSTGTISIKVGSVVVRSITTGGTYRTVYYLTSVNPDVR